MIEPGSPEHSRLVSPSKVAAILGISRYESQYRLWHRMKGLVPGEPPRDEFTAGHAFEPALAHIWRQEHPGWRLSPGEVQYSGVVPYTPQPYNWVATLDRRASRGSARHVVELKTARSLEDWGDDFTGDVPADYAAQVIAQMMWTGLTRYPAHLMVMGPFFKWHTYVIEYDPEVAAGIDAECAAWWMSLRHDTPPPLDDSVATYQCVRELHPEIDGTTIEIDSELATEYVLANRRYHETERCLRGTKTRVLDAMGNAAEAVSDEQVIAKRVPHGRGGIALKPVIIKETQ